MSKRPRRLLSQVRMVDWAHLKSELVWVYEGNVVPPYDNTWNHNEGYSALLLLRGRLRVETELGAVEAHQGQWVFPRQGRRLQRFMDDPRVLSVHFNFYWPGGQPLFHWDTALVLESSEVPQLERQTRILHRVVERNLPGVGGNLLWERGTLNTHLRFQRAFDSWLYVFANTLEEAGITPSRVGPMDERILKAVHLLDDLPLAEIFNEQRLAAEVNLSSSQLDRLFLKEFSRTPRQYFEGRRIEYAKNLIVSAPLSMKQITYEIGFSSLPSFSRWFRQKTGLSPKEYKKTPRSDVAGLRNDAHRTN